MSEQQFLKTSYDNDPLMYGAFVGCVRWALGEPEIMARYREESRDNFEIGVTGLERMVDAATGADLAFFQRFSDWVEVNLFGTPEQVYGGAE